MQMTKALALELQASGVAVDGRCGAKNRRGLPCLARPAGQKNGRCKFHGGLSTGPKTPEAKARSIAAMQEGRRRRLAARRATADQIATASTPAATPPDDTAAYRRLAELDGAISRMMAAGGLMDAGTRQRLGSAEAERSALEARLYPRAA